MRASTFFKLLSLTVVLLVGVGSALAIDRYVPVGSGPIGSQEYSTIQAAITAANAGDIIIVAAGTYNEAVNINKSVTLLGAQANVTPVAGGRGGGESVIDGVAGGNNEIDINADNVVVNGFEVANQKFGIITNDFGAGGAGGLHQNVQIIYNYVHSTATQNAGIVLGRNAPANSTFTNYTVSHNLISVSGGSALTAIALSGGASAIYNNTIISYNDITNPNQYGIFAGASPATSEFNNTLITHNNIHDVAWMGINIMNLLNAEISYNTFTHTGGYGAYVEMQGGTVNNNTFQQSYPRPAAWGAGPAWGLLLDDMGDGAPTSSHDVGVTNNTFEYNDYAAAAGSAAGGIRILSGVNVGSITLSGNTFNDHGQSSGPVAIRSQAPGTLTPAGNNVFDGVPLGGATTAQLFTITDKVVDAVDFSGYSLIRLKATNVYVTPNSFYAVAGTTSPSINRGIIAATAADVVNVAAGTYAENININKKITLQGAGSGVSGTVINPALDHGMSMAASGSSASDRLTIKDLRINAVNGNGINMWGAPGTAFSHISLDNVTATGSTGSWNGIEIWSSGYSGIISPVVVTDLLITNSSFINNGGYGLRLDKEASVIGLTVTNSHFDGNSRGWYAQILPTVATTVLTNVNVSGTTFNDNGDKGIILERLDNAVFDNITMNHSGYSGNQFSIGMEVNCKYGNYSNITIQNSTFTNNGSAGSPTYGAGIAMKARDDGGYSSAPASLSNVTIISNIIEGNTLGVLIGEPGKSNLGPLNVQIHNNSVKNNVGKGLDNQSQASVNATCNWYGTTDATQIAALISGSVNYTPWLNSGSDNSTDPGFQPVPGSCVGGLTYTVDASVSGGHGTVSPASQTVGYGGTATINIIPDPGYLIATITDNGNATAINNPYKISNVTAIHTVVVTFAISAFGMKQAAIDLLTPYIPPYPKVGTDVQEAIKKINESLNPKYWFDADPNRLTVEGTKVFDKEKEAVKRLRDEIIKKWGDHPDDPVYSVVGPKALAAVNDLLVADNSLASVAIADAKIACTNMADDCWHYLVEAQEKFDKAMVEYVKGRYPEAIDRYKEAWQKAMNAQKKSLPKEVVEIPTEFELSLNYPNPFNPTTVVSYQLPVASDVKLVVFDVLGREVTTLVEGPVSAGYHQVVFDASNLSSGIYFYRMLALGDNGKQFTSVQKMLLMK